MELPSSHAHRTSGPGYTFNDILLDPRHTDFTRDEIQLGTQLTERIALETPFVSAPMDTVTEAPLAIALGQLGGIGIIHRNLLVPDQAMEVAKVKSEGLLVGAAVGTKDGFQQRVDALGEAGVDVIVVDTAHGDASFVVDAIEHIRRVSRDIDVIGGNIATGDAAKRLIDAGAHGLRVGVGPGSICTTRIESGMGVPQITALLRVAEVAQAEKIPFIADGGIVEAGDIVKALAMGASSVMFGNIFARTEEAVGEIEWIPLEKVPSRFKDGLNRALIKDGAYPFKNYRGMGSVGAMRTNAQLDAGDEYHGNSTTDEVLISEGVEGKVPLDGSIEYVTRKMLGGLRSGMNYTGSRTIPDLWTTTFNIITQSSLQESRPHDLLLDR